MPDNTHNNSPHDSKPKDIPLPKPQDATQPPKADLRNEIKKGGEYLIKRPSGSNAKRPNC
jgi:hypothetical protein